MRKILKTISALLIVSAIIICSAFAGMSQAFAEEPSEGGTESETVTVKFYDGDNPFTGDLGISTQTFTKGVSSTLRSDYPTKDGDVFLYWNEKGTTNKYLPGYDYTLSENIVLEAVYGDKASSSDGIKAVTEDGQTVVELKYNGGYQTVHFIPVKESGNTYTQDEAGYYLFDQWDFLVYTANWYISLAGFDVTAKDPGEYKTPLSSNEYCKTWTGTVYKVTDEFVQLGQGTVKIYYEITYDANGGVGEFDPEKAYQNSATLTDQVPTKEGMTFKGWATSRNATEAEYQPGEQISLDDNLELYAVWQAPNPVTGVDSIIPAWFAAAVALAVVFIVIPGIRRRLA
ncbi:MAG: InlB B-repeat-containing protein [Eubacteriaceae bacterium]|nr:InlB B-repeat-containing protein [Eubacteriaceae bacterium]